MCDNCGPFLQLLESYEEQVRKNGMNERPVLSHQQVEVLSNYVHTWPQRQCFCGFRDAKNFERFNLVLQSVICLSVLQLKAIKLEGRLRAEQGSDDQTSPNPDGWGLEKRVQLLGLLAKMFLNSFPLYLAYKHCGQPKMDEMSQQEVATLSTFCELSDPELPLYLLRYVCLFCKSGGIFAMAECFEEGVQLEVGVAQAIIAIVCNLKVWLNYRSVAQLFVPLRSRVLKYLCNLSDKDLRLPAVKNMSDFMWAFMKDPTESGVQFDREGLDLAFKYFTSSTLTMRLAGIAHINVHINLYNELCNSETVSEMYGQNLANWLIDNTIIAHIFGPNLHVEVIKQSQLVLSFLAMEGRLSNEHLDTIWAAAQLKHCSRQVHDLLPPLIKHLEARPVLHLYRLLCRLEPKEHSEQSLFLASALIKFIWSSSSSEALLKALPAQRRPQSSSENSVSMDGSEEEESEDGRKTPSTASEEAKRPSTDSSTASSMRPGSRRGMMMPQRPQKAPSESDDEKKMVPDFMMVEDDEEDEEHSQASSSGGCLPSMLSHEAIVVTPEECATFPHRSLVESEDGEESGCEEEELSQLAAQAHQFGAMSNIFQSRFHSRAGSLLEASRVFAQFSVENVCKAGNTLLWDLLQDETIGQLGDGLALEAEKALCNLLCYNIDRYIRLKFIEGCLDNLEKNRSVVVSLRLLPKLLQSFQQFRSSAEIQHTTMWAEQEHHMMPHFFSNLMLFTANGPRHPNLFPQLIEVQVRLNFLTSVYSAPITPENFRLSLEQVDILWNCLTIEGQCSDELASWLLSQARSTGGQGPPELHALSFDALRHLYLNKLPSLQPETISMISLSLFQQLCNLARVAASQPNSPLKGVDTVGMQHLWKVALKAKNTDVSMAAIQYLNSFYVGRQLEQESEFVEQCMAHLEMATSELSTSQELSLTYIQRAVLLLRTHLEIFRRRYAYHLRRWYLEGQGVVSHIVHAGEGSPLRVVVQPAGVPDKSTLELQTTDLVAELRAEVAHWYEGLQARSLLAPTSAQSTPVLGSLLAEGPIRIITQGQELNPDFDEKTLQEMGFKDNQLIFISMGATRPNKKRDEAASLLPPPPRDSLPTLLLLQPKYFDQLFSLLHTLSSLQCADGNLKAQVLSRRVWEILTLLPTSPTLLKGFQALGSSSENCLETLLDPASPQKLMYSLYIVESLSKASAAKRLKMLEEEGGSASDGVSWSQRFIRNNGLKHLYSILMSGVLQKGKLEVGEWQQDCLAQLLKLLCQLGVSVLEESPGDEVEALRRKNKRPANRLVDRLVVHRLNEAMLLLMEVDSTMARLTSILLEASRDENKTGFWGRAQVVHFAMALLVSWVHSSDEAKECLFASSEFKEWLRRLVLEDPEPSVRREVCAALCRMCLCAGSSSAAISAPLLAQLLQFLPAAQEIRPSQTDEMEEGKEHYGPASKDYFWLLCHLLDSLSEDFVKESLNGGCVIELEGLAVRVSEAIAKRDYLEGRLLEDEGLVGLLNLACNIIKHDPPFKTSVQGQTFLQQVFDFLFSLPDPSKRYLPKCKSILARNAAYDLLVEMCRRAPKNYAIVHTKLLEQHQPKSGMDQEGSYPWDYWPHEDGRADCGFVGLTNLGATCYMASCMQHLYMMPQARNAILQAKVDSAGKHGQTLVELQRMFAYLLESERKAYNPRSFCKVYQMDHQPLNTGEQKDMAEFFIDLVSKLEEMTPELKKLVKTLFCGVLSNNFVSLDCNHVSRNVEEFYTVRCQVADMRNLYESLDEVTVKDTLEGDNMYTCSQCSKKVRAEKRACFKKLPHILCFNTMRYTFNMLTMLKEKVNTHFSFPLRLDMSGYVEKHLMPQHYQDEKKKAKQDGEEECVVNGESENYIYNLIGVTVHTGTADGGHYYSFIKDRTKDKWFLFNDAEIKPFDSNQLATECFGGEMTSKTYDSVTDKFLDFSFEKTNSAYMLFYEWSNSSYEPEPSSSMLGKDLEDWIWKDNRNFLRDKNIFEHTYFNFMWQMCSYVPQSLLSGALSEDKLAELTASFFLETFVHAKEKPMLVQWVDLLSRQLCNSELAGEWFLGHMADDYWWPLEIFIKCPSQMVRQTFQRLCLQIISKLRPQHAPLYLKTEREGPDSSCITKFINMLLNLLDPGAKTYIRHLTEYFSFLYDFSKLGEEECQFLISVNTIASFVFFLVGPLDAAGEMVSVCEEEEEDEIVALPTDKYKPTSLEKMITLVATLVEKSRGEDQRLQISQVDLTAITGGKGFPFLYLQIKDSINLPQTRNLIFALTRYNERLALQIVGMIFSAIHKHSESTVIEKLSLACQPFFKLLSLLTDTSGGGPSGLPCFSQLILNRIWEAAEHCPQSTLEWLAIQVPRNKMVAAWVLESIDKWVEPYLIAHNNNRVRNAAANLLVALVPNPNFKNVYRHPRNLMHSNRECTMSPEATQVQHKIYSLLLELLKPARQYIDASVHGTTKLGAFFALLTHFATSRAEKLMFGPYFMELWQIFHPKLSEPAISINQNKQTLLLFWNHVLIECRENVSLILQDPTVIKNIAFNYILADHDDQELLMFNRHMLPPYYGILRLCCQESRSFTRHLANHQNIQWAFKNITPYHMHYPDAVDELFKLMQLFVMKHPDSNEQELQDITAFRRNTIQLYLQTIEGRNNWSTLVAALRILLDNDEDRLFLAYQTGLGNLLEGFIALHMMYHEATACHVGGDLMELLGIVHDTLRAVRLVKESKDVALSMSLGIKDLPEALRRLATLLNTYNPAELRQIAISILQETLLLQPTESLQLLVPLLTHCHMAYQETHNNACPLGPYFPRRGQKMPVSFKINVRPQRPMVQMIIPHAQISLAKGVDEDYDKALVEFYLPYHRLIDLMVRVGLSCDLATEPLVNLSAIIGYEAVPLHLSLFPLLWTEAIDAVAAPGHSNHEDAANSNQQERNGPTCKSVPKLSDLKHLMNVDQKYVDMLIQNSYLVEYLEAVLLDERTSLNQTPIYKFVSTFLPKVKSQVLGDQTRVLISKLVEELIGVSSSMDLLAQSQALNGDLRALIVAYNSDRSLPISESLSTALEVILARLHSLMEKLSENNTIKDDESPPKKLRLESSGSDGANGLEAAPLTNGGVADAEAGVEAASLAWLQTFEKTVTELREAVSCDSPP